ncbi:MAG: cell surface protein SprA [Saprospiraceae bacterium]|nr:cell surface protein SprA [Saprospiraceae bacterium]
MRKERTGNSTPLPWDISNFTVSYGHTETEKRDPLIQYDRIESDQASLDYGFSFPSKYIEPFKKLPDSEWLKFLRDFNFNPIPNSVAFSTAMYRETAETRYRFTDLDPIFSTFFNKQFTWDRNFTFNWDLAKSLKFNFNSTGLAIIDEPNEARLREENPNFNDAQVKEYIRDSIWSGIQDFGRPKNYTHNLGLNFTVPTKSLPFMDWITLRAQYNATYGWTAAAINTQSIGNIIQNSQKRQITGDFNFDRLYDEWNYLKQINRPTPQRPGAKRPVSGSNKEATKEGEKEKKQREPSKAERALIRPLLLVRKGRLSYSEQYATLLLVFTNHADIGSK